MVCRSNRDGEYGGLAVAGLTRMQVRDEIFGQGEECRRNY